MRFASLTQVPSLRIGTSHTPRPLAEMPYFSYNDGSVKTMESKAKEAALREIEKLKKRLKELGDNPYTAIYYNTLEDINEVIKEYKLQDRLDVVESIYNILMDKKCYTDTASYAKKYGL